MATSAGELSDVCPWPVQIVRSGVGPDGSASVRAFQRCVLNEARLRRRRISLFTNAIAESVLRRDGNGNPAVDKSRTGREDRRLVGGDLGGGRGGVASRAPVPMAVYTLDGAYA